MAAITVTVSLPETQPSTSKGMDRLERTLEQGLGRVERAVERSQPDFNPLLRAQDRLLDAITRVKDAVSHMPSVDLRPLERSLDRQWTAFQLALKQQAKGTTVSTGSVALPDAFFTTMDALQEAMTKRSTVSMPAAMSQKLDAIALAIEQARPKVRGMLR